MKRAGRRTLWAVAALVVTLLLAGAYVLAGGGRDDDSLRRVQTAGALRIGLDASFPPFETVDAGGTIVGFDADLARLIADQLGVGVEFTNIGFDGLYDALQAGRIDTVISGLPYDERRTRDVNYSRPYFNAGQLLVVAAGSDTSGDAASAEGPGALAGRRVAVEWGSMGDMHAREWQSSAAGMRVQPYQSAGEALDALAAGQADTAVADAVSVFQFMGARPGEMRVVGTVTEEALVIATPVRSHSLSDAIDLALGTLMKSGVLDDLLRRHRLAE